MKHSTLKNFLFGITGFFLLPTPALAYNFLYIHPTTGEPITWEQGTTIEYYLDPGPLGRLTNDQAHTLLKEAMKIWEEASPLAQVPHFEFAGYLPEDVTGTTGGDRQEYYFLNGTLLLYIVAEVFEENDGFEKFATIVESLRFN